MRSQQGWAAANEKGLFDAEIAPIEVAGRKRGTTKLVDTDEHPRPDATLESMAKLPPVFDRKTGVVTAANASGINDGAGSIILASEKAVKEVSRHYRCLSFETQGQKGPRDRCQHSSKAETSD